MDKEKYDWEIFKSFCEEKGISLESEEDWGDAWDCWVTAYKMGRIDSIH